ncbi:MAG: VanW family protein [Acidimicrobiales bacterium]
MIVTVLGYDGETVARADYEFTLEVRRQVVSSFTTPLEPGERRNNNIHRAADYIDGDVIPAGWSYSLNDGIGERTEARGFGPNGYIDEVGNIISVTGGGVSQMGTTFLNASWLAGLRLDEFRQHTIYFERYPMCREATLAWNLLDVVVTNDTPYDLTIDTSYTSSSVTVALVGVRWAEVDSWIGEPFDTGGVGGPFSIRCGRTVTRPDGTSSEDAYLWRYNEGYPG